jgi:uncharacterized membrane protein
MQAKAAITVLRPRDEVERQWRIASRTPDAKVSFRDAPGDRGTEIHVELQTRGGVLGKLTGGAPLERVKDELRHFKAQLETGEVPRSEGTPTGDRSEKKLRPAQPLDEAEREALV